MNLTYKATLGVILIFILGSLAGCLVTSIYFHHRNAVLFQRGAPAYIELVQRRLTRNLALDPTQKQSVAEFFMQNLEQRQKLQAQIQPQVQALNLQTVQQIRSVLNPDQAALFRENLEEFRKRFGRPALKAHIFDHPSADAPAGSPATNAAPTD
jgi:hypothetical protein